MACQKTHCKYYVWKKNKVKVIILPYVILHSRINQETTLLTEGWIHRWMEQKILFHKSRYTWPWSHSMVFFLRNTQSYSHQRKDSLFGKWCWNNGMYVCQNKTQKTSQTIPRKKNILIPKCNILHIKMDHALKCVV